MRTKYPDPKILALLILLCSLNIMGQERDTPSEHYFAVLPGFVQIKDAYNYGLVQSGFDLSGRYILEKKFEKNFLRYEADLGIGLNVGKGAGIAFSLKPVDLFYGIRVLSWSGSELYLGPSIQGMYLWQLYPELQSGHMFWYSSFQLGTGMQARVKAGRNNLLLHADFGLAVLSSRPGRVREEYYYSLRFEDFARNPHKDMQFRFPDDFRHFSVYAGWPVPGKNIVLGYEYHYTSSLGFPAFRYSLHHLSIQWKLGKK